MTADAMLDRGLMRDILTWVSRATGVGYRSFPPMIDYQAQAAELEQKTDALVLQVEQLERELRRRGQLSPR